MIATKVVLFVMRLGGNKDNCNVVNVNEIGFRKDLAIHLIPLPIKHETSR